MKLQVKNGKKTSLTYLEVIIKKARTEEEINYRRAMETSVCNMLQR